MRRRRVSRAISYAVLVAIGVVGIAPFAYLLVLSSKSALTLLDVPPSLHVDWATVKANYGQVIHENHYLTYVENSILVTGAATFLALVLGVPAAYGFSRLRFRGADQFASTILSFRFMPPVAVAIPVYLMINSLGLVNSYPGLILPYIAFSLPLVVWIMIGFFDEIPREIDEAALVDGLTRPLVLLRVLLPLARPGMLVAATFGVIFTWNEFLVGLYIINSTERETIPIAASALLTVESPIDWNIAAAVGIVTVIPVLLFALVAQRWIVRGITAGAVR
jgi:multiple sugar transport system permease protein